VQGAKKQGFVCSSQSGKLDNIGGETLLVLTTARDLALRRAMLPERRTGATLGDMQLRSHLLDAGTVSYPGSAAWKRRRFEVATIGIQAVG
jgi:hypothetical protein